MGATGVNPQLSTKQSMVNSLPPFPTDIKNASVTNVPNMVSCLGAQCIESPKSALGDGVCCDNSARLLRSVRGNWKITCVFLMISSF